MPDFMDTSDVLRRSTVLRQVGAHRVAFDPSKRAHCESLKTFLETGNWGDVMFYPEYPYTDVPTYVLAKFACHNLKVKRKTVAEAKFEQARERVKDVLVKDDLDALIEITEKSAE